MERKDVDASASENEEEEEARVKTPTKDNEDRAEEAGSPRSRHSSGAKSRDSSSGSEIGSRKRKKVRSGSSGDESPKELAIHEDGDDDEKNATEGAENVGRGDIFGDDLSISSDEDESSKEEKRRVIEDDDDDDDNKSVQRYGDDDEDMEKDPEDGDEKGEKEKMQIPVEEEEPIPETRIEVQVPKITTDLGKELHFVKLPNFLSMECRPFEPEHYEDEIEDEDSLDEEGRARLKLKVENTIRWRMNFDADGKAIRESNARMVRWSDGSMSLHLGNEVFDVYKQPLQGDFNHLFIRQGTGLQGQAVFRTKLSFRPHSTESFTHQKLTRNMADRTNKASGIKVISQVGRDPEANRYKRVKEEEERLRAAMRRDSKQKRIKDRASHRGLSGGYLEDGDSDEDGLESLNAIKNRFKRGKKDNRQLYSSGDEDSDVETSKAKRLEQAKTKNPIRESDEESETGSKRSRSKSPSRSRSRSKSKSKSRSRSRSKSNSPASRSGSGSPHSRSSKSVSRSRSASKSRSPSRSRSPSGSEASGASPRKASASESE